MSTKMEMTFCHTLVQLDLTESNQGKIHCAAGGSLRYANCYSTSNPSTTLGCGKGKCGGRSFSLVIENTRQFLSPTNTKEEVFRVTSDKPTRRDSLKYFTLWLTG